MAANNDDVSNYMPTITVPTYLRVSRILAYIMYIWVIFGIAMLSIRVFLLAFSANLSTPFANFVYNTSNEYLQPFRGIFPPKPLNTTGYLDVASVFAIIIYLFLAWLFSALVAMVQRKIDQTVAAQKEGFKLKVAQTSQASRQNTPKRTV